MPGCEFSDTSLKGMDVCTCEISAWKVDFYALQGMKVTGEQALGFTALLGLKITDV